MKNKKKGDAPTINKLIKRAVRTPSEIAAIVKANGSPDLPLGLTSIVLDGKSLVVTDSQFGEIQAIASEPGKDDPDAAKLAEWVKRGKVDVETAKVAIVIEASHIDDAGLSDLLDGMLDGGLIQDAISEYAADDDKNIEITSALVQQDEPDKKGKRR